MNPLRASASFLLLYYVTSERTDVVIIYSQAAKQDEDKPQDKPEHSLEETKEPNISIDQRSSPTIKQWPENKHRHLRKAMWLQSTFSKIHGFWSIQIMGAINFWTSRYGKK